MASRLPPVVPTEADPRTERRNVCRKCGYITATYKLERYQAEVSGLCFDCGRGKDASYDKATLDLLDAYPSGFMTPGMDDEDFFMLPLKAHAQAFREGITHPSVP